MQYRRRTEAGHFIERYGVKLDNGWVVPYNLALLKRFRAHINVEWCNKTHLIKYLFKYITKGPDRARAIIESFGADVLHRDSYGEVINSSLGAHPLDAQIQHEDVDIVDDPCYTETTLTGITWVDRPRVHSDRSTFPFLFLVHPTLSFFRLHPPDVHG